VDFLLLEDQTIYTNFFDWMFKTSRKKLLIHSYDEYWRRLCQYFELFARRRVGEDARQQMRRVSYILYVPKQSMLTLKFLAGVSPAERKIP
jgi:isochorismate hydrolase